MHIYVYFNFAIGTDVFKSRLVETMRVKKASESAASM